MGNVLIIIALILWGILWVLTLFNKNRPVTRTEYLMTLICLMIALVAELIK